VVEVAPEVTTAHLAVVEPADLEPAPDLALLPVVITPLQ
jgi:hypothetical protein